MTTRIGGDGRRLVLALLIGAPAVAAALLVTGVALWRIVEPDAPLFNAPQARTLADAIQEGDARREYRFLREGQDPNELVTVRIETPEGTRALRVSPLVWAVSVNRREAALVLVGHGARLERPMDRHAACLAAAVGNDEVAGVLRAQPGASADPCPALTGADGPLLLSYLSQIGATE